MMSTSWHICLLWLLLLANTVVLIVIGNAVKQLQDITLENLKKQITELRRCD